MSSRGSKYDQFKKLKINHIRENEDIEKNDKKPIKLRKVKAEAPKTTSEISYSPLTDDFASPTSSAASSSFPTWVNALLWTMVIVAFAGAIAGTVVGSMSLSEVRGFRSENITNDIYINTTNNITNEVFFNTTNNYTIFECCNSTSGGVNVTAGPGINVTYLSAEEALIVNDGIRNISAGANANIDYTDPHEPIISCTGGTSNITTQGLFTIVDVDITAADLAGGATKIIWTPPDNSVYIVLQSAIVVDQCVDFDVGGDYDIIIQFASVDGELSQIVGASILPILSSFTPNLRSIDAGLDPNTINQPSNVIRAAYSSGGTTDYTSGSIHLRYWLLDTNAMSIGGSGDSIVYVKDVSITAAALASGGQAIILDNTDPAGQYEVITAYTSAFGSTDFSGGGGDRDILITDGTSDYGRITAIALLNTEAGSFTYGDYIQTEGRIQIPITNSISIPTVAGADIYATYTGGTTDWTDGELIFSIILRKIAGNNAVGVQSVVEGPGITVDSSDPQNPIVSVTSALAATSILKDNGNVGEVFYLADRSAGFGLYKSVIKPFEFWNYSSPRTIDDGHYVFNICIDSSDNVYITGYFRGTLTLGSQTVTSNAPSQEDIFVAKLLSTGTWDWIKTGYTAGFNTYGVDIVTDNTHLYVSAYFVNDLTFDGNPTISDGLNVAILKLTTAGTYVDLYHSTQPLSQGPEPYGLKLLSGGDVVTVFLLFNSYEVTFGATTITSATENRIGIARLNTGAGTWTWATVNTFTGDGRMSYPNFENKILAVDSSDNIYFSGIFESTNPGDSITMGSTITSIGTETKLVIAQMDSSGVWQWALSDESLISYITGGTAVTVDGTTVYVSGYTNGGGQFGTTTLPGVPTVFIATCTTAGVWNSVIFQVESGGEFNQLSVYSGGLYVGHVNIAGGASTGVPYLKFGDTGGMFKLDLSGTPLVMFNRAVGTAYCYFVFNSNDEPIIVGNDDTDQVQFEPIENAANQLIFLYRLKANFDLYTTPNFVCVLLQSGLAGDTVEFTISGVNDIFSGLTSGTIYYWDPDTETRVAQLTNNGPIIGPALSTSKILFTFTPGSVYTDTWNADI